jgi:hypothetical protein
MFGAAFAAEGGKLKCKFNVLAPGNTGEAQRMTPRLKRCTKLRKSLQV